MSTAPATPPAGQTGHALDHDADGAHGLVTPRLSLGPEWVPGADGVPFRRGARVLLFDEQDRLLLVRGHDVDQPERSWWFTVGGGIGVGESPAQAASRELFEETGIRLAPDTFEGPVLLRQATFDFRAQLVRQDEEFFLARVTGAGPLDYSGWEAAEVEFMDEVRWFDLEELAAVAIEVFPRGLVDLARPLLRGWDGVIRDLGPDRD